MTHFKGPRISARAGGAMRGQVHVVRYARFRAAGRRAYYTANPDKTPEARAQAKAEKLLALAKAGRLRPGSIAKRKLRQMEVSKGTDLVKATRRNFGRSVPSLPDTGRI